MNPNKNSKMFIFNKRIKYSSLTKLKPHLLKIELVIIVIASIGYFFKIKEIITISLLFLATLYFLMGFAEYKTKIKINIQVLDLIIYTINWARAISITSILYVLINWPNNEIMFIIGMSFLLLSLPVAIFYIAKGYKDEVFSLVEFSRNLLILITSGLFYLQNW